MGFSRQEHWSGLSFPSPGNRPDPAIKPVFPPLAGEFFTTSHHENLMLCIGNFICLFCELNLLLFGYNYKLYEASLVAQMIKNLRANAGDAGLIPGLGRSPGGGHGNSLQYSCLENPHGQRSLLYQKLDF